MNTITREANNGNFAAKVWAWTRRGVYAGLTIALFAKGLFRLEMPSDPPLMESIPQMTIVFGLVFFPVMRALGLISQDHWVPDAFDKALNALFQRTNGHV